MVASLFGVWLIGAVLAFLFPRQKIFFWLPSLGGVVISLLIAWNSMHTGQVTVGWKWFTLGTKEINFIFEFDSLTLPMLLLVTGISFFVHVFALGYTRQEPKQARFFATLGVFTMAMVGLILSANMLVFFVFWELVGLCSFLLIGFYREKPEAAQASFKALIINKFGDVAFLIALGLLWMRLGSFDLESMRDAKALTPWIGAAFLVAALAKSAQFPFHSWLPDAMVGPTPVSALIHSATMVAAGVFLLARVEFLLASQVLQVSMILGGFTALMAGYQAFRESDLKKFLAWSTVSQLGLMFLVVGLGLSEAAFVHLLAHAIFKAGLFLAVGVLIQHYHPKTLSSENPLALPRNFKIAVLWLCCALAGVPFTIGFLSKETLLSAVNTPAGLILIVLINFVTAVYAVRLMIFVNGKGTAKAEAVPAILLVPVMAMALASLWLFYSWSPLGFTALPTEWKLPGASVKISLLSIGIVLAGLAGGFWLHKAHGFEKLRNLLPSLSVDPALRAVFINPVLAISRITTQVDGWIDQVLHGLVYAKVLLAHFVGWTDKYLVDGLAHVPAKLSFAGGAMFRYVIKGNIQQYLWWTFALLAGLVWLMT